MNGSHSKFWRPRIVFAIAIVIAGGSFIALPSLLGGVVLGFVCGAAVTFFYWFYSQRAVTERLAIPVEPSPLRQWPQEHLRTLEQRYYELLGKYELLVNNIAAAIIVRDEASQVIFCSPYGESLFGYSPEEVIELSKEEDILFRLSRKSEWEAHVKAFGLVQLGEPYQYRFRYYHRSGVPMWAETRIVPILEEDAQLVGSLSITIDVTASVRYEQRIEEKNRDLNDFAFMLSHDLKAPIYTVKGMTHLLREELETQKPSEEVNEALGHIGGAVRSLESLVNGILEYSRVSQHELSPEPVDVAEVLGEVERDYKQLITEQRAELTLRTPLPVVLADHRSVYQIFSNLVGNALKYTREGVPPRIEIEATAAPKPEFWSFTVSDNGRGIAESDREEIFRPFHRGSSSSESAEGLGIGLACVHKLLERLGGDIRVEAARGGSGTVFIFTLPMLSERNANE